MRDGIREKELSDLGIEATVEDLERGRVRVELDRLALDQLIAGPPHQCEWTWSDIEEATKDGYNVGYATALEAVAALAPKVAS